MLPKQPRHDYYRIIVTESTVVLLPKTLHSKLPKSLHFKLPLTAGVIGGVTDESAKQAAARQNERELDRFPYGREGSASDQVGITASPGVSLAIPLLQS